MGQRQTALDSAQIAGRAAETGFPAPNNGNVRVEAFPAKSVRGRAIDPPLKAWLDKILIPVMVSRYIAASGTGEGNCPILGDDSLLTKERVQ